MLPALHGLGARRTARVDDLGTMERHFFCSIEQRINHLDALGEARTVLNIGAGAGSYEPTDREVTAVEPSATMRAQRLQLYTLPDYLPRVGRATDYGFDPAEQATRTFTGMGSDINVHDQWAVESPGPIQDRTREHLGTTDKGVITYRKILVDAIQMCAAGQQPLMVLDEAAAGALTGPASIDGIGPTAGWNDYWQEADLKRRRASDWAAARLAKEHA